MSALKTSDDGTLHYIRIAWFLDSAYCLILRRGQT